VTYRYEWTEDERLDKAASDLSEIAAFAMETLAEDPAACIPLAASYAVNHAYNEGGMEGVRDLLGHYEAFDQTLRTEARREAA